ncbi:MAG: hypothetical protein WAO58_07465 [Fimbriimonadaceae bacterium]
MNQKLALEPQTIATHEAPIKALAFSPDGQTLATADVERNLRVWRGGEGVWQTHFRFWYDRFVAHMHISALAFSPGGEYLYVAVGDTLRCYEPNTGRELWRFRTRPTFGFLRTRPISMSVGQDGSIAIAYDDTTVDLRDPNGWPLRQISAGKDNDAPNLLVFLADGRIAGTDHVSVCIWDVMLGAKLAKHVPGERIHAIAASPDGRILAIRTLRQVQLWSVEGEPIATRDVEPGLPTLAFSQTGGMLACGHANGVALFDLAGNDIGSVDTGGSVTLALAFQNDGSLAIAGSDGLVRVWTLGRANAIGRNADKL